MKSGIVGMNLVLIEELVDQCIEVDDSKELVVLLEMVKKIKESR